MGSGFGVQDIVFACGHCDQEGLLLLVPNNNVDRCRAPYSSLSYDPFQYIQIRVVSLRP